MSEATELTGPDLSAGIALDDVPDGGSVVGHANGQLVLVARRGEKVFAVGATCSHYGGPLGEGLLVGTTVRCPWHHACFDLETGEPSAPAFNPIPCYRVDRRGDRITVGDALERPKPAPVTKPARVVIVGAGASGAIAAESLRRFGYTGSVVLLGAEATAPIDRPNLSKDYLAGTAPEEWMEFRGADFYREQNIDFRPGTRVTSIDVEGKTVSTEPGESVAWDALILATGAEPVRLNIPGAERI